MAEVQDKKTTDSTNTSTSVKRTRWVEWIFINLPFVCYLATLGIVYIYNAHTVERYLRRIDKLKQEVMDEKWLYLNLKQDVVYNSTQSQLAKKLEEKDIKPIGQLPKKLKIKKETSK